MLKKPQDELRRALNDNNFDRVKRLIFLGIGVDTLALHYVTIATYDFVVIKYLLDLSEYANLDIVWEGVFELLCAKKTHDIELITRLVAKFNYNKSVLSRGLDNAIVSSHSNLGLIQLLIDLGANIHSEDVLRRAFYQPCIKKIEFLLSSGAPYVKSELLELIEYRYGADHPTYALIMQN